MNKIIELIKKYKSLIAYLFFGVCSTIINIVTYAVSYNVLGISNVVSNIIAWITAVIFAFITNKLWVFESKSFETNVFFKEMASFFGCRFLTLIMDVAIMYVGVDVLHLNAILFKVIANVVVVILNYVASKLIIFKKDK